MNKALATSPGGGCTFFDVPENASKSKVMELACDAVETYGEDICTIVVFDGKPEIKWRENYYFD